MASAAQHQITAHERECVIFRANTLRSLEENLTALKEIKALMSRGMVWLIMTMLGLIGYLAHIVYAPR